MNKKFFILITLLVVTFLSLFVYCNVNSYKNQEIYFLINNPSMGISSDFVLDFSYDIDISSFDYYLVKEIPVILKYDGTSEISVIRSWHKHIYVKFPSSHTSCRLGVFSSGRDYTVCYVNDPLTIPQNGEINLSDITINAEVLPYTFMDSNQLDDYVSTCETGLIQDNSVIFTSEENLLKIMSSVSLPPVSDFHDIYFDYAILILPNYHNMNDIEIRNFIYQIQSYGYVVKRG